MSYPETIYLVLDILGSILLIVAPFIFSVAGHGVREWVIILGVFEIVAAPITESQPRILAGVAGPVGVY